MNKHTVDLKRAKKLKELGWEKETLFGWYPIKEGIHKINDNYLVCESGRPPQGWDMKTAYPAPIASELLKELPDGFFLEKGQGEQYFAQDEERKYSREADTPVKALADMWIYLKKEGLI